MTPLILIAADLAAISILSFALYLRRHRRRDLVVSYLGMNVGVMAVAAALSGSAAGVGLGLGLFGVLSIIRLRSTELAQHEVAYYFSALALGLIAGLGIDPVWLPLALMAMILLVMFVGDHSRVLRAYRHQTVILDRAIAVDEELHARVPAAFPGGSAGRCGMTARAHAGILGALRLLPPIGLDALNAEAALQTRVDRKYVVPEAQAQELLATFTADVRVLEMDRCRCFAYDSVYFDTAGLDSYLLAARGRRRRYKVRTRTYVDQRRQLPGSQDGRRP